MKKKHFTLSNIFTAVFIVLIAVMLIFPGVKAGFLKALMTAGLFQPNVTEAADLTATSPNKAPAVVFADEAGNLLNVHEQKGKVVFINFWATWCPPCIAEMGSIQQLYDRYGSNKNVVFLMVDLDNQPGKSLRFMEDKGYTLPVYFPAGDISRQYFSGTLPTTVVVDRDGNIRYNHAGVANYSSKNFATFLDDLVR